MSENNTMSLNDETRVLYETQVFEGENLLLKLKENYFLNVRGTHKLQRKIQKDILFLSETVQNNKLKKEHLVCTNLHFYKAVVQVVLRQAECEAVLDTFSFKDGGCQKRLTVDIISNKGQQWIKVIARNPVALQQIFKDGDNFGRRSIMDQASSYLKAAAQNLHLFCPPQVMFSFVNGVPEGMKYFLERLGISVEGKVIVEENTTSSASSSDSDDHVSTAHTIVEEGLCFLRQIPLTKLNLCVTTMLAYVSSLTNGGCNKVFLEPLLNQQAEWERSRPVKPLLANLFKDKELICCSTAMEDFKNITDMVGGEEEKRRAEDFLSTIKVVPDVTFTDLKPSGKIKKRSLVIFGTGHVYEAVTVTANRGFVHASKQQGVKFAVIIHESRALTERKALPEV